MQDEVLETKKAYVRFIFHEMRTPLNVVFLGLNILGQDIGNFPTTSHNSYRSYDQLQLNEYSARCRNELTQTARTNDSHSEPIVCIISPPLLPTLTIH